MKDKYNKYFGRYKVVLSSHKNINQTSRFPHRISKLASDNLYLKQMSFPLNIENIST